MNELIAVKRQVIGDGEVNAVDARELHTFLESGQQFGNWILNRVEKYGFMEGVDFIVFNNLSKNPEGGRPRIEYAVTLDMAKQLAMVEQNDKGKQARLYFIECEKQLIRNRPTLPQNYAQALRAYADEVERREIEQTRRIELERSLELANEQIGDATNWKTVKAIPWLSEVFNLNIQDVYRQTGIELKKLSGKMGTDIRKVPDNTWGKVNAYNIDVIYEFKEMLMNDISYMGEYRKSRMLNEHDQTVVQKKLDGSYTKFSKAPTGLSW